MSADTAARLRIREELDTTMVVVAGAGTGKTTELVQRIVRLVASGSARLRDIAAITFTEAAAAELRERIRLALGEATTRDRQDRLVGAALEEVDDAAISTLHGFAQRILLEHCAAAGLPSGFEVLDDTRDAVDFEARWARFAEELLEDLDAEPALVRGFNTGLRHTDLRAVAKALHENWDRLEESVDGDGSERLGPGSAWPEIDPSPVVRGLERALSLAPLCTESSDNLLAHLHLSVADALAQLAAAQGDEEALMHLLASLPLLRCSLGRQENWGGRIAEVREACAEAERARSQILGSLRTAVLRDLVPRLVAFVLRAASERRAEGRLTFHDLLVHARGLLRADGEVAEALRLRYRWILVDEFQDTDPIQVELAARLASESDGDARLAATRPGGLFVVGDPKQSIYRFRRADIELFEHVGTEIGERIVLRTNFRSVPGILELVNVVFEQLFGSSPEPGQAKHHALHGDRPALADATSEVPLSPHQTDGPSRNRPNVAAGSTGPGTGADSGSVQLSFDELPSEDPPVIPRARDAEEPSGGTHEAGAASDSSRDRPPVVVLGGGIDASVPEVRRRAARDIADCIQRVIEDRWQVADTKGGQPRAPHFGDVAVLMPTRSSLPALEEAFEEVGVPYRLEGASMLWDTEEVRVVLAVLRAADDPADELSVVTALRSPGLGCGDNDLVSWRAAGGRWDPRSPSPDGLTEHPVSLAMAVLGAIHRERWWCEPSELVARAVEDLRGFELAFAYGRPRDHWHRLRWLCDQARLFDETAGGTLRSFLSWAQLQAEGDGGGRAVGPPDPDDDAVRVMTIHGAKGLEFPVVVLAGLERQESDGHRAQAVLWAEDGSLEVRAGPLFSTEGYEEVGERDQELDNLERRRLLYVGMTRPRDQLILCLHHRSRNGTGDSSLASALLDICETRRDLWRRLDPDSRGSHAAGAGAGATRTRIVSLSRTGDAPEADGDADGREWKALCERWSAERAQLLGAMRRRPVTTATALVESAPSPDPASRHARVDPGWPDTGATPSWSAETALQIGRAVHGVLATIDLSSGGDPSGRSAKDLSQARAVAHGIPEHADAVATMVDAALSSAVVRRAATRRHWREVYVAVPLDVPKGHAPDGERSSSPVRAMSQGVLEGYVDLLFEEDEGLVVVDYKTDRIARAGDLQAEAALYSPQVGAYATALEASCGRPVSRCVLLFVGDGIPVEHVLEGEDLVEARARALQLASVALAR